MNPTLNRYEGVCAFICAAVLALFSTSAMAATTDTYNSSTTWLCPAGVTSVQVECWGGGGGSGGTSTSASRVGGGGAGGAYVKNTTITVAAGTTYTITVGAGGTAGAGVAAGFGGKGGSSSFSGSGITTLTAVGGVGGTNGDSTVNPGPGGLGSATGNAGFSGSFSYAGGNGAAGTSSTISGAGGGAAGSNGAGGNATTGTGGTGGTGGANGAAGRAPTGAGTGGSQAGGGASGGAGSAQAGAVGGAGRIIVIYDTCSVPPLTTDATAQTVCPGATAVFTVATSAGSPSYQWRKNAVNLSNGATGSGSTNGGATTASLGITNVGSSDVALAGAGYDCVISVTGGCSTNSSKVALSTNIPASVSGPAAASTCTSGSATFTVTVAGTGTSQQWQISTDSGTTFSNLTGSTSTSFTTNTPSINANGNKFRAVVSGTCGSITSSVATLTVSGSVTPGVGLAAAPGTTICAGTQVIFTATPTNGGGSPTYVWKTNGVDTTSTGTSYTNSALVNGVSVRVEMTSSDACASPSTATNSLTMTVNALTTPSVTVTTNQSFPICAGTQVIFTANPVNGGATPSYQWKLNGGNVGVNSATYTNSSLANSDVVAAVLTPSANICPSPSAATNSVTATVTANVTPSVSLSASPGTDICAGTQVIFTATPANGGSPTYAWKTNGVQDTGISSSSATYTNSSLANGATVSVTMTSTVTCVTAPTASSTNTIVVHQFGNTNVTLINENFTAQTGWTLGTGWSVTATTPLSYGGSGGNYANFTPGTAGNYLTSPTVDATGDLSLQLNFAASRSSGLTGNLLVEASTNNGTAWDTVTTIASASISSSAGSLLGPFSLGATYNNKSQVIVRFSMTSPGGTTPRLRIDDVTLTGTVSPATAYTVSITPGGATTFCAGNSVQLTAAVSSGTGYTYSWSPGTGLSSTTVANPTATPAAGSYTYTVTVTAAHGCTASANQAVTVNPTNAATITLSTNAACSGTSGLTASVASAGAGASYTWTVSNGTINSGSGTTSISFTVTNTSGTAVVSVNVTNSSGCGTTSSSNVTINPIPSSTITAPTTVCPSTSGNTASVPNAGAGATYAWSISGGTIDTGSPSTTNVISFTSGASGTVNLTNTVTSAAGCVSAQSSVSISIGNPSATITASAVCSGTTGNTASVPDAGVGATYAWSIGNGTITAGTTSRTVTYTAGTSGTVQLTNTVTTAGGCSSTGDANVTINPPPATTISSPGGVCASSTANTASITDAGGSSHYGWRIIGGSITAGTDTTNITFTANASGTVSLSCIVTNGNGCIAASATNTVTIVAKPSATITKSTTGACGGSSGITASVPDAGVGATYGWTISNGTIDSGSTTTGISFTLGSSGNTVVSVAVTNSTGCASNNTATVTNFTFNIPAGSGTVLSQDFTAQASWTLGTGWSLTSTTPLTNSGGVGQGQYANFTPGLATNYLTSPSADASGNTDLQLSFYSTHSSGYAGDLLVEASTNGGTSWTTVTNVANANIALSTTLGPVQGPISLGSAFNNKSAVQVRFSAAGSMAGTNPRLRIDNVSLTGTARPAAAMAAIVPTNAIICTGSSITLTGSLGGASYQWYSNSVAVTDATNDTFSVSVAATYSVTIVDPVHGCSSTASQALTVSPLSVGGTSVAAVSLVQSGSGTTITNTGYTGTIQWQSRTGANAFANLTDETNATVNTGNLTTTTDFRAVVTSSPCSGTFSTTNTITVNHAPVAISDTYDRGSTLSFKIIITDLLTNDTDAELDTLHFVSTSATTTNGAALTNNGTLIFVSTNNVNDAFTYTIHDGNGGTNSGTVYLIVTSMAGQGHPAVSPTPSNTTVTFYGIPGVNYHVQRDTNTDFVNPGVSNFPSGAAPTNGIIQVTDNFSDINGPDTNGSAFYRLVSP